MFLIRHDTLTSYNLQPTSVLVCSLQARYPNYRPSFHECCLSVPRQDTLSNYSLHPTSVVCLSPDKIPYLTIAYIPRVLFVCPQTRYLIKLQPSSHECCLYVPRQDTLSNYSLHPTSIVCMSPDRILQPSFHECCLSVPRQDTIAFVPRVLYVCLSPDWILQPQSHECCFSVPRQDTIAFVPRVLFVCPQTGYYSLRPTSVVCLSPDGISYLTITCIPRVLFVCPQTRDLI